MRPTHSIGGQDHRVAPIRRGDGPDAVQLLEIDGVRYQARLRWLDEHQAVLTFEGEEHLVHFAQDGATLFAHIDGHSWRIESVGGFAARTEGSGADGNISAPMPGVVLEIDVEEGDAVSANQRLALIESMKMQTEIKSPMAGTVLGVRVAPGDTFERGATLIEVEGNP